MKLMVSGTAVMVDHAEHLFRLDIGGLVLVGRFAISLAFGVGFSATKTAAFALLGKTACFVALPVTLLAADCAVCLLLSFFY